MIRRTVSYPLHLLMRLVDIISLPADQRWWFASQGSMRALEVVEGHPLPHCRPGLGTSLPGMHVNSLAVQGSLQPLDEDIVEKSAFPIH
jgi:hypothetical protein